MPTLPEIKKRFFEIYDEGKKNSHDAARQVAEEMGMKHTVIKDYLLNRFQKELPVGFTEIEGFEDWMVERVGDLADSIDTPGLDIDLRDDVKILFRFARRIGQLEGQGKPIPEKFRKILDIFENGEIYTEE
jgi:hypothetical protein